MIQIIYGISGSDMQNTLATLSLVGLSVGCWMAWPPLGLIVPSGIVFMVLLANQIKRG